MGNRVPGSESRAMLSPAAEAIVFREVQIADATEKPRRAGLEGSHGNMKCLAEALRLGSGVGVVRDCVTIGWKQQQQAW